jgi:hypothetical protein
LKAKNLQLSLLNALKIETSELRIGMSRRGDLQRDYEAETHGFETVHDDIVGASLDIGVGFH